ncbi:MAG: ABC transporter ATP-binding protein [Anaerolineae bacterium]
MAGPLYRLEKVVKTYGEREILNIEHLEVIKGELLGIVGPSGAGKSTLLRLLNFLETPTAGKIHFLPDEGRVAAWGLSSRKEAVPVWRLPLLGRSSQNGHDAHIRLDLRRRITTVFQRPVLLNTSVYNNVAYGLRLRGARNFHERVMAALEMVGMEDFAKGSVRTLSGGEAQRVALARALVIEPEVLLLDEPTANLDPYNVSLIEKTIASLNREKGTTVVLVTHNVFQARRLSKRTALLLEGRIVEINDTERFFTAPQDPRTAAFVRGEMVY